MMRRSWISPLELFEVEWVPYYAALICPSSGPFGVALIEMVSENKWQGYVVADEVDQVPIYQSSGPLSELCGHFLMIEQSLCAIRRMRYLWRAHQAQVDTAMISLNYAQGQRMNDLSRVAREAENELY